MLLLIETNLHYKEVIGVRIGRLDVGHNFLAVIQYGLKLPITIVDYGSFPSDDKPHTKIGLRKKKMVWDVWHITNKKLFFLSVIKYGIEFKEV